MWLFRLALISVLLVLVSYSLLLIRHSTRLDLYNSAETGFRTLWNNWITGEIELEVPRECRHRDYGNGATVCVCTADYCDNLEHVNMDLISDFLGPTAYVTSKDGDRFKKEILEQNLKNDLHDPQVVIMIDPTKRYQKIVGFGGAFTDSAGMNIDKLGPKLQERLIGDYYGPDGIEYTLGRIPIGGSDFSLRPYTYDDNAGTEDLEFSKFQLQYEDLQFKIPYLTMAAKVSPHLVKYFGSPWSPPAWMKTNKKINNGGFLIGNPGGKYYKAFAQYLVRFLQHYNRHNVSIWGLTIENEPKAGNDSNYRWNSLGFTPEMERDFLKLDLWPALNRTGYTDLKVMIFDDNLPKLEQFVSTVLVDLEASQLVSGIAFHWYENQKFPERKPLNSIAEKFLRDKNSKYFLLATEACEEWRNKESKVSLGDWATFDRYADDIIKDLNHWTSGWVDWNLALDLQGGPNWAHNYVDASIIVNGTGTEYYKQPFFYALGHFSKFLSPNSIRLGQKLDFNPKLINRSSIQATTFLRPDNRTVLTVLNTGSNLVPIWIQDSVQNFQYTLKPNSLSSFIW